MPLFNVGEFINVAVKDEETGIAVYKALAQTTKDQELKSSYLRIMNQEEGHAARFRKMLEEVGAQKPFESFPGEYDAFLNALLESRAFYEPSKAADMARKVKGDSQAVDLALRMEKDTLLFYLELKQFIPKTHQEYVSDIITEEEGHIRDLQEIRRRLLQ